MKRHLACSAVLELETGKFRDRLDIGDEFGNGLACTRNGAIDAFGGKQKRALDAAAAAEGREWRAQGFESVEPAETIKGGDTKGGRG